MAPYHFSGENLKRRKTIAPPGISKRGEVYQSMLIKI
jgi:hypothetical protein